MDKDFPATLSTSSAHDFFRTMIRYSVTILISAFLLFQVQPLIARYILPWFGGTPAVWNTCMLFFQLLLLVGYAYSHVMTSKVKPKMQAIIHVILLLAALVFLPIIPSDSLKPQGDESPTLQILMLLTITIGLPYVLLSTTGPLVQAWFARTMPGRSPYRLFALSNFGSLVALISYPFLFEPNLRIQNQAVWWSWGFVAFVGCCIWCAVSSVYLLSKNTDEADDEGQKPQKAASELPVDNKTSRNPDLLDILLWIFLSAVPSVLLLASTSQLCQEVAVVAFLWVLPLSLYLISFIICFDNPYWYQRTVFGVLLVVSFILAILSLHGGMGLNLLLQVVAFSTALFAACMTCHGELAASKPDAKHLTLFYLMVSIGGALGGIFVVLIAPRIFVDYWELHAGYLAALVLTGIGFARNGKWGHLKVVLQACAVIGTLAFVAFYYFAPLVFFEEDNFWYRAIAAASIGATGLFGVIGFGFSSEGFSRQSSAPPADAIVNERRNGGVFVVACMLIGSLIALGAGLLLLKYTEEMRSAITWREAAFVPVTLALIFIAFRYAVKTKLFGALSSNVARWAHNWIHIIAAALLLTAFSAALYKEAFNGDDKTIVRGRDFYGVLRVREVPQTIDGEKYKYRKLMNGRTLHGQQITSGPNRSIASGYYLRTSGVGRAITFHPNREDRTKSMKLGVVGLGIGTIAAYGREGDIVKFYEINKEVERFAREYFYYLNDSAAEIQIAIGDARIEMERELDQTGSEGFDVLAIDAFSSDAIPRHLLTSEVIDLYLAHLADDGILAIHISNRHLELEPIVYTLVRRKGLVPAYFEDNGSDDFLANSSTWVVVSRNNEFWNNGVIAKEFALSEFVVNQFSSLPEFIDKFGEDADLNPEAVRLNFRDVNKEVRLDVSGSKADGQIVFPGKYDPDAASEENKPDAMIVIDGEEYPLFSNLDEKYYWTDDFGSLWSVSHGPELLESIGEWIVTKLSFSSEDDSE